jgi:hypothetical protein
MLRRGVWRGFLARARQADGIETGRHTSHDSTEEDSEEEAGTQEDVSEEDGTQEDDAEEGPCTGPGEGEQGEVEAQGEGPQSGRWEDEHRDRLQRRAARGPGQAARQALIVSAGR